MGAEYLAQSPVEKATVSEAKRAAAALIEDLAGWGGSGDAAWDKRVGDTAEISGKLAKDKAGSYEEAYLYKLTGAVVGIMVIDEDLSSMHIKFIVTHPGTQLVGGALIEKAVERSCEAKYNGSLELISHSPESTAAYEALGFVALPKDQRASHRLDPAKSPQWERSGNTFVLKKYLGKKYVS